MLHVGIRELKNHLSRFLVQVKSGEEVVITERGRPIARIVREPSRSGSVRRALEPLVEEGLVEPPARSLREDAVTPVDVPEGRPASEIVLEERR